MKKIACVSCKKEKPLSQFRSFMGRLRTTNVCNKCQREKAVLRQRAASAVASAIIHGALIRPDVCSVSDGRCRGRIEAHHASYDPSHWLDVKWLCKYHHENIHKFSEDFSI